MWAVRELAGDPARHTHSVGRSRDVLDPDDPTKPFSTSETVDLGTWLAAQVAISELPGAIAYLDEDRDGDGNPDIVFKRADGEEFTRVDIIGLSG